MKIDYQNNKMTIDNERRLESEGNKGPISDEKSLMGKWYSGTGKFEDPQDCISSHNYQKTKRY